MSVFECHSRQYRRAPVGVVNSSVWRSDCSAHALEHAGGYTPQEARRVAATLLPDMLSYDPTRPASFPGNGRTLTDDAADAFLAVLTNGRVMGDKVEAHSDLLAEFPYLGPPHNA